jgi:hypothetical protein
VRFRLRPRWREWRVPIARVSAGGQDPVGVIALRTQQHLRALLTLPVVLPSERRGFGHSSGSGYPGNGAAGRREDIITTAVTSIVVMVVALASPEDAWRQPLLRLFDTAVGIVIGVAGKWIASFAFYKARGGPIR